MVFINVVEYSKYTLTLLFLLLFYVVYLLLKPLLLIIITAIIIAYLFSPLYKLLNKKVTKNRYISSFIVLVAIFLLVSVPTFFILHSLANQGISVYTFANDYANDPNFFDCTAQESKFCSIYMSFISPEDSELLQQFIKKSVLNLGQNIFSHIYALIIALPSKFMDFFILIFMLFFLFTDGHKLLNIIRELLPMKLEHETYIITTLKETTDAIVFGQTVTAVLQGVIAGVGFWIFGVSNALLLGVLVGFLAIIPFVGSTVVFVPIALYYIITGFNTGADGLIIKGFLLIAYCLLFISTIDTFLKPKIIGDKAKLHPALVLLGVIGGVAMFGIIGFFLGPIIFGLFLSMINIYKKEKRIQMKREVKK